MHLSDLFYIHTEILDYVPDYLIKEYEKENENNSLLFIVLSYSKYKNGRKIFETFKNKCITENKIDLLIKYAKIKGRRIKEFEPYITKNADLSYLYAKDIIRDRFPEAEFAIGKDPKYAYLYAKDILEEKRFRPPTTEFDAEPFIGKEPYYAYKYSMYILKGKRFRPPITEFNAESYIIQNPEPAYLYTRNIIKGRFPEAEPFIGKDPYYTYLYARDILKGKRFRPPNTKFNAEPYIMQNPELAYLYAKDIIKDRFPEAELFISKTPRYAYRYSIYVLEGKRFRPPITEFNAEPYIAQDPEFAYYYAKDIIKGRFQEAEKVIYEGIFRDGYEYNILEPLDLSWEKLGYDI